MTGPPRAPVAAWVRGRGQTRLSAYLARLIWLCVLPLLLIAAWLAADRVRSAEAARDREAANLAQNFATAIDQLLGARIGALNMLAISPLVDDPSRWGDLYREAQGFGESFGSHVILASADEPMRMLFNTRVPFGQELPLLPRPKGRAAAPTAVATGQPAVGDIVFGPVAKEPLVAIAVPVMRQGRAAYCVLTLLETRALQARLDRLALPAGWSLALRDGRGDTIASRGPPMPAPAPAPTADGDGRWTLGSAVSLWSVRVEIPPGLRRGPLIAAALGMAAAILGATLVALVGGTLAGRRLSRSVAELAEPPRPGAPPPAIAEIAAVRRLLDETAAARVQAESTLEASERRFEATFEQAALGLAQVGTDGRWLRVNRRLCAIVGYTQEELLARTFQSITHPDDLDANLDQVRRMLAREIEHYSMEKRYLRKDGSPVWVRLTVALVWRPGDGPDYFVSAVEDIQALKESQSLLHEAQHLAGLGHWRWDLKADRHLWSDEIYRIYGRDPSLPPADYPEVRGYFTPESWAGLAAAVEQGLAQGTPWACDAQVVRPDGTRRWIVSRGEAVRDGRGEPLALRGTVQDITERKLAEEALREGEALLRGFFENAEGIVWVKDLAGRFIRVNRYTEQAIGRSRAEILGRTVAEIFPESEADAYAANDRAVLDAGVPMDFEEEARLADGVHSFLSTKYPLRDGEGPVFGLGAICIDITRLKRAEAALKESEETFRSAFANAAIGFALASPQGGILEVNHAYCTITGYRAAELGGLELRHLIHPDDLGPNRALMERMLAGDIADFVAERRLVRRNRSPLWVRTSVSLVRDGQGRPRRVVELVEDISERKSAEEENLKLNADLERRVALRTRELSAANRELDAFAYAVSHDLRAPLRAMSGFSRALVEDYGELLPGEAQGWLDQIGQASRRMGELIDGLLTLSRATRGKPARDPIDLSGMARRVLDELAGVEPGRRVETRVEPGLGARGDPRMIESVLRNLLENAWKYTGRTETPWIRVYGERRDGQPWVCIEDNGAGFSQARAGRLFQVFQRLHRQDEFPGLGIGLATVARILHRHGGRIEATGEPGRGARFCFHLPDEGGDPQES